MAPGDLLQDRHMLESVDDLQSAQFGSAESILLPKSQQAMPPAHLEEARSSNKMPYCPQESDIHYQTTSVSQDVVPPLGTCAPRSTYVEPALATERGQSPECRLWASHERLSVTGTLIHIYQHNLDHALSTWSTIQNCPYLPSNKTDPNFMAMNGADKRCASFYERACALDTACYRSHVRGFPALSPSQNQLASQALQKAILAFSSQWTADQSPSIASAQNPNTGCQDLHSDLAAQLHFTMQKTLWHDAQHTLQAAQELVSFKVLCAYLIFAFIPSPHRFDAGTDEASRGGSTDESESWKSSTVPSHSDWHDHQPSPHATIELQDPVDELWSSDPGRTHLEWALRQMLHWRRKLHHQSGLTASGPKPSSDMGRVFSIEFNVLFWLAIMCDTTSSAISGRTLVISDLESAPSSNCTARSASSCTDPGGSRHTRSTDQRLTAVVNSQAAMGESFWNTHLLHRYGVLDKQGLQWPLPEVEIETSLKEAIPIKVLLFRRVGRLQVLIEKKATAGRIENAIQDAEIVYRLWQTKYGPLMAKCKDDGLRSFPRVRSLHFILAVHWHYGGLLLAQQLQIVDSEGLGKERACAEGSFLIQRDLSLANALHIADLARSCRDHGPPLGPNDNQARPLMSEPWCEITVRAMSKAATVLLRYLVRNRPVNFRQDCLQPRLDAIGLSSHIGACTWALSALGRRYRLAQTISDTLCDLSASIAIV